MNKKQQGRAKITTTTVAIRTHQPMLLLL